MGDASDIGELISDEVFHTNEISKIRSHAPETYHTLIENSIDTMVVVRIGMGPLTYGYLMCAEKGSMRIWNDNEFAVLFALARMIAGFLRGADKEL